MILIKEATGFSLVSTTWCLGLKGYLDMQNDFIPFDFFLIKFLCEDEHNIPMPSNMSCKTKQSVCRPSEEAVQKNLPTYNWV